MSAFEYCIVTLISLRNFHPGHSLWFMPIIMSAYLLIIALICIVIPITCYILHFPWLSNTHHSQKAGLVQGLKSRGLPSFSTLFAESNCERIFSVIPLLNQPMISCSSRIVWKILDLSDIIWISVHLQLNCS